MTRASVGMLVLAVAGCLALGADSASASQPKCGDTITADATLHHNLVNCPNNGIIIGADNVTLDLNYHRIDGDGAFPDRKSTRLNSSHSQISYAVFCLKKKKQLWIFLYMRKQY